MNYFTFNGVESSDYGVYLEKPAELIFPGIRYDTQAVIGSSKVLHYTEGADAMDPAVIALDCAMLRAEPEDVNAVFAWLRGGGTLLLPQDEDHYFRAWVAEPITLTRVFRNVTNYRFTVEFECEPHRYHYPEAVIASVSQGTIRNPGTAPSEPEITITGSGDITITIGDNSLAIADLTTGCVIDCESQTVYVGTTNLGAQVTRTGDWPTIPPGGCEISWTGSVTNVAMRPRWRDY